MKVIKLIITLISCLIVSSCQKISFPQCFKSLPNDSNSFGNSLAINNQYLLVGDLQANKVIVYSPDTSGKWVRKQEILPPKDSSVYRHGSGFGADLALDENILTISAFTQKRKINDPTNFEWTRSIYQTVLGQETKVKLISPIIPDELPDFFVAADRGRIAFTSSSIESSGKLDSKINIISHREAYYLPNPNNIYANEFNSFIDIAIRNNLLLVANPSNKTIGGAWLFDLNNLKQKPKWLSVPNALLGTTVAISDQFMAVGELFGDRITEIPNISPKTFIKAINNDSTTIIGIHGKLSLDKNILAIMRYKVPGIIAWNNKDTLEVFRLDKDATPHRIIKRKNISNALVQNSFLTTVQKKDSKIKICVEALR